MTTATILIFAAGVLLGACCMWLAYRQVARSELARSRLEVDAAARAEILPLREALARHEAESSLSQRHGDVAAMLAPIRETLARYDEVLAHLGRAQAQTSGAIGERLDAVSSAGELLRLETQRLSQALRAPSVRGQWGELQLKRVCELAGMLAYCDFDTQVTVRGDDGAQRPDLVVRLPGERQLVVDAKAPVTAYLEALAATDERTRTEQLAAHASHVRAHVMKLAAKKYWSRFDASPEFVVLFLPGESFFAAALETDPSLLELALSERVLLASPITLIALLKAAAFGWRQERVHADAAAVAALGQELHERLSAFGDQLGEIGKGLERAVSSYNRAVGSLEKRVLVTARRLSELHDADATMEPPAEVELAIRAPVE